MTVIDMEREGNTAHWRGEIGRSDWRAGQFLFHLLRDEGFEGFHRLYGEQARLLLLTEGEELVSFCTYAEQDDIPDCSLTPWAGFVYTFPQHRGRRRAGALLERARELARACGHDRLYLSSDEEGLYEKYGFTFCGLMKNGRGGESRIYYRKTE